jgi:hypothetical protein
MLATTLPTWGLILIIAVSVLVGVALARRL